MTRIKKFGAIFLALLVGSFLAADMAAAGDASMLESLQVYGYMSVRMEKVFNEPSYGAGGQTLKENMPREMSLPSFNIMMEDQLTSKFKVFMNLDGDDGESVNVQNMWGEYAHNRYLNLRTGKFYRRFGLFNEKLDAVPTYSGTEPTELFDEDHLILSRTSMFMIHGDMVWGDGEMSYAWTTDNGEGGPADDNIPMGVDVRYAWSSANSDNYMVGLSGYSSNGAVTSDVGLGAGSPQSGVLPWMASDDFMVFGAYTELQFGKTSVQGAWHRATHDANRDPGSVVQVINNANPNTAQMTRFLVNPAGAVNAANVRVVGDYDVTSWFLRAGHSVATKHGEFVPFAQWDYYSNPETIQSRTWGGDNEAGLSDDGTFNKGTLGVVYRPIPEVAFKLDTSMHFQDFNGDGEAYPEIRFDVSYVFGK
jgi:hypothetical protein